MSPKMGVLPPFGGYKVTFKFILIHYHLDTLEENKEFTRTFCSHE